MGRQWKDSLTPEERAAFDAGVKGVVMLIFMAAGIVVFALFAVMLLIKFS